MDKLIITAAVTGSVPTRTINPNVPYSPEEIANEVVRSWEAGASIAHVHVRDPITGGPSFSLEHFREVRDRVRPRCNILLNFTTSGVNVPRDEKFLEHRARNLSLKPDICSHDIGSMNFLTRVSFNPPEWGPYLAKEARRQGVKPELEIFDSGHFSIASQLISEGLLDPPYWYQLCFGVSGGTDGSLKSFLYMTEKLPAKDAVWSTLGIGPAQFPMITMSIIHGGHARVGFEDNVYLSRGVPAKSNAELVEKAVRIAKEFGREIAGPDETRKMLGIQK